MVKRQIEGFLKRLKNVVGINKEQLEATEN